MKRVLFALVAILGILLLPQIVLANRPDSDGEHKAGLCHRTASDTNPYVFISVTLTDLPAHLNDLPGHPAEEWKSAGTFRGVVHESGDLKRDYVATSASECDDFSQVTPGPSPEVTPDPSPEVTPGPSPEVTPGPSPEVAPGPSPEVTPDPTLPATDTVGSSSPSAPTLGVVFTLLAITATIGCTLARKRTR